MTDKTIRVLELAVALAGIAVALWANRSPKPTQSVPIAAYSVPACR